MRPTARSTSFHPEKYNFMLRRKAIGLPRASREDNVLRRLSFIRRPTCFPAFLRATRRLTRYQRKLSDERYWSYNQQYRILKSKRNVATTHRIYSLATQPDELNYCASVLKARVVNCSTPAGIFLKASETRNNIILMQLYSIWDRRWEFSLGFSTLQSTNPKIYGDVITCPTNRDVDKTSLSSRVARIQKFTYFEPIDVHLSSKRRFKIIIVLKCSFFIAFASCVSMKIRNRQPHPFVPSALASRLSFQGL